MKKLSICISLIFFGITYSQTNSDFIQINKETSDRAVVSYQFKKSHLIAYHDNTYNTEETFYNRVVPVVYNGVTRYVDADRSGTYKNLDKTFILSVDDKGYTLKTDKGKFVANIRQTDNDTYLYANNKEIAYVWFKSNGDMIVESYHLKEDVFIKDLYIKI